MKRKIRRSTCEGGLRDWDVGLCELQGALHGAMAVLHTTGVRAIISLRGS
jgi:hypothetical protein